MGYTAIIGMILEIGIMIFKFVMKNNEKKEEQAKKFLEYLERWDKSGEALAKYRNNDALLREKLKKKNMKNL